MFFRLARSAVEYWYGRKKDLDAVWGNPRMAYSGSRCQNRHMSLAGDVMLLVSLLALLAFSLLITMKINRNRKVRGTKRRIAARLVDWRS
jgi:hypothetical protein